MYRVINLSSSIEFARPLHTQVTTGHRFQASVLDVVGLPVPSLAILGATEHVFLSRLRSRRPSFDAQM